MKMFPALMSVFILVIWLLILIVGALGTAFWIWMIIDVATKEPSDSNDKVMWVLIVVLTGLIGAAIYYFVRRPERIKQLGK
jgi:prolipoprotein diacylglyceryltransferase